LFHLSIWGNQAIKKDKVELILMRDMEITNKIRKVLEIKEAIKVVIIKEIKKEMIIEVKDD
jgi:hypothetical protein